MKLGSASKDSRLKHERICSAVVCTLRTDSFERAIKQEEKGNSVDTQGDFGMCINSNATLGRKLTFIHKRKWKELGKPVKVHAGRFDTILLAFRAGKQKTTEGKSITLHSSGKKKTLVRKKTLMCQRRRKTKQTKKEQQPIGNKAREVTLIGPIVVFKISDHKTTPRQGIEVDLGPIHSSIYLMLYRAWATPFRTGADSPFTNQRRKKGKEDNSPSLPSQKVRRWSNPNSRQNRKEDHRPVWTPRRTHVDTPQPEDNLSNTHKDVVDPFFFSLLIPLNEIFHVALSYLRMYAYGPGTLWGEHPSEQISKQTIRRISRHEFPYDISTLGWVGTFHQIFEKGPNLLFDGQHGDRLHFYDYDCLPSH
ncbi:hypothetical protein M9H77_31185 [Catharanthus roseus]|uniref:Uncharacterized protein n=1 Tax=Catharanthus roseus TaxID=4058 RepID=A0ACB9ZZA8_CATRO|nr:hypothetical protein M9H77_31185 [Catharanthus roseus]